MKIFIGLQEIAGYYTNLKKGFDENEVSSAFINLEGHRFNYGSWFGNNPLWANLINVFIQKIIFPRKQNPNFKKFWEKYPNQILRWIIFVIVLIRYDVVIFAFGYSFFGLRELKFLKKLGKKIIFVFNGSDARPIFIDGFILGERDYISEQDLKSLKIRKEALRIIETHADAIVNSSSIGHHFSKPFYNFISIGLPLYQIGEARSKSSNTNISILHSPSDPIAKGTPLIRKVIKKLKKKGYNINYIELINKTNTEVLSEMQNCDFVIDQLYSDIPLAGIGNEAAFFGKPAVIGSYYAKLIHKDISKEFIPPSALCLPEELEKIIERLIKDKKYRMGLGKKAEKFVRKNWAAKEVAKKYLKIIQGKADSKWKFDPQNLSYVWGAALSAQRVKKIVKSAIELGGVESLELSDKPKLEQLFKEMIKK